jgi:hypothetical protein
MLLACRWLDTTRQRLGCPTLAGGAAQWEAACSARPDGTQLAATDPSGTFTVRTRSGAELTSITIHSASCLAWSSANSLAIGQNEGWPAVFNLATGHG